MNKGHRWDIWGDRKVWNVYFQIYLCKKNRSGRHTESHNNRLESSGEAPNQLSSSFFFFVQKRDDFLNISGEGGDGHHEGLQNV